MTRAYYNDSDPFVCAWLRNLIADGHLPDGEVDERPIQEVQPNDVRAFTQCHFFAGIGGWAYALRLASWPEDRPVWTGSCPCQPFSAAGKRGGTGDARHLWPAWADLIRECQPPTVFGEQVASSDGVAWFDAVSGDLEGMGYAVGAADLSAAGVGAPHIRQRLWFVADTQDRHGGCGEREAEKGTRQDGKRRRGPTGDGVLGLMADAMPAGRAEGWAKSGSGSAAGSGAPSELAYTDGGEPSNGDLQRGGQHGQQPQDGGTGALADSECGATERRGHDVGETTGGPQGEARQRERLWADPWASCEFIPCRDGKARPTQPGLFPLAHGIPGRVGRLRAYGNAIVPEVAAAFVPSDLKNIKSPTCRRPECTAEAHKRAGRARVRPPWQERFWQNVRKSEGCWEWTGCVVTAGYGAIGIGRRLKTAHRVSYELHYGMIPKGLWVLHHCDNPRCVRPDHLYAGTCQDNVDDAIRRNRDAHGEGNGRAKLTAQKVREIRSSAMSPVEIAPIYGISATTVRDVTARRTWNRAQ